VSDTATKTERETTVVYVKSKDGAQGSAHFIIAGLQAGRQVQVHAVGAGAVNVGVKAIVIAGQFFRRTRGAELTSLIDMRTGRPSKQHPDSGEVSVVVITVDVKEQSQ